MSWAEDMGFDGHEVPVGVPRYKVTDNEWITGRGESIRICDMTNEHLYNAYKKFNDERLEKEIIGRIFKRVCL